MRTWHRGNKFSVADGDKAWRGEIEPRREILDSDVAINAGKLALLSHEGEALFLSVRSLGSEISVGASSSIDCKLPTMWVPRIAYGLSRISLSLDGKHVLLGMEVTSAVFKVESSTCESTELGLSWAVCWGRGNELLALDSTRRVVLGDVTGRVLKTFEIRSDVPPLGDRENARVLVGTRKNWPLSGFVDLITFEVASPTRVYSVTTVKGSMARLFTFIDVKEWPGSR